MEYEDDPDAEAAPPPSPDDRLWRHPSEVDKAPIYTGYSGRPGSSSPWKVALAAGTAGAILTGALVVAVGAWITSKGPVRSVERVAVTSARADNIQSPDVVKIAEKMRPALVELVVLGSRGRGSGSGVIFREDGHVLTNAHVVRGASTITVVMSNGKQFGGSVVGRDPETDIAVVRIDAPAQTTFHSAVLGTASDLKVGQAAIAIGSPLGLAGGPSVSVGVVSALGRQVESNETSNVLFDMIQTDAPIAPGSSGGALLDGNGALIGITTAIAVSTVGAEGLGFAVPVDVAREVAEQLMTDGRAEHPWVGVMGDDLDAAEAERLKVEGGAVVKRVQANSPAKAAGILVTDVIVSVDGQPVQSMADLIIRVRRADPGDKVKLGLIRDGKERTVEVTLGTRPATDR